MPTSTPVRPPATETPKLTPTPTPEPQDKGSIAIPAPAAPLVALAQENLIERLGLTANEVAVTAIEPVEWRDTSLGCPQPGMMYAQVITPGYRIVIEAAGQEYTYPTDRGQKVIRCDVDSELSKEGNVNNTPTVPAPIDQGLQQMVALAVEDLAGRLDIGTEHIDLLEVSEVTWSDASLGCPHPEMRYKQVPMDGLLIRLSAGEQVYAYHSGGSREPFLCEQAKTAKGTVIPPSTIAPPRSESE
jgi:hypothetical protein